MLLLLTDMYVCMSDLIYADRSLVHPCMCVCCRWLEDCGDALHWWSEAWSLGSSRGRLGGGRLFVPISVVVRSSGNIRMLLAGPRL